jgi:hypothetical protein
MDAAEVKKRIANLSDAAKYAVTRTIVDTILDQIITGHPIGPQEMVQWMADMVDFTEKLQARIEL